MSLQKQGQSPRRLPTQVYDLSPRLSIMHRTWRKINGTSAILLLWTDRDGSLSMVCSLSTWTSREAQTVSRTAELCSVMTHVHLITSYWN